MISFIIQADGTLQVLFIIATMSKKFLENESYTFLVAKIAILVQSFITSAIVVMLLTVLFGVSYPYAAIVALLWIDVMFVVAHLSYRRAYRGPKVILRRSEKAVLILHVLTALLALCMTFVIVQSNLAIGMSFITMTLLLWITSLILGIVFFTKKYAEVRVLRTH